VVEGAGLENRSTARYRRFESCPLRHRTAALACGFLAIACSAPVHGAEKPRRPEKPEVSLRAAPRVAVAPARIVFTAELKGGPDSEALHCLTLKWSWGDGTTSSAEGDCGEFVPGTTKVRRLFQADHEYRQEGRFTAEVTIRKGEKVVVGDSIGLTVAPRPTDPRFQYRER
jgi:hypothetical protein